MRGSQGTVTGFAGVLVWTDQFDAMLAFYRDTLGLATRSFRPEQPFVSFEWGDVRLSISAHEQVHGIASDPFRIMLNFAVDDIEAAFARLRLAGVPFLREPETEPWGGIIATFADPDGNLLQLFQLPR